MKLCAIKLSSIAIIAVFSTSLFAESTAVATTTSSVIEEKESTGSEPTSEEEIRQIIRANIKESEGSQAIVVQNAPVEPKPKARPIIADTDTVPVKSMPSEETKPKSYPYAVSLDMPLPSTGGGIGSGGVPGLGVPPNTKTSPEQNVVNIVPGVSEVIYISYEMPNRIATPYQNPKVIDASGSEIQTIGSNVFVRPINKRPIGIFISDESSGAPVASLTLVPRSNMPSQSVLLQIDRRNHEWSPYKDREADTRKKNGKYTDQIVSIMRKVALNDIPRGFVVAKVNVGLMMIGPIVAEPEKRWSSTYVDAYRYKMKNNGTNMIELSEQSFYESGVKAISIFPKVRLLPGEETFLYIVSANEHQLAGQRMGIE